jgi:hypothetical protein
MIIFALMAVLLFAIAGLAVDAGLSYITSNSTERAAAAAALSGVTYMPGCFTAGAGCTAPNDATDAALATSARNGFAAGSIIDGHAVTVTPSPYPPGCSGTACDANKLTVTVTAWVPSTFMRIVGFGDHEIVSTETAYYLPQLTLGQPGGQLGTTVTGLASGSDYILRNEGWNTGRSEGDAYEPNPVDPNNTIMASTTDIHGLNAIDGTDFSTISGFNTVPSRGGYNYQIVVPGGTASPSVEVYNPAFAPDPCISGGIVCYHEDDSSDQADYSVMEYTLFRVNDVYDHLADTPLVQVEVDPINATGCPPINNPTNLNALPTCAVATDARTGKSLTLTAAEFGDIYHNWADLFEPSALSAAGIVQLVGGNWLTSGDVAAGATYRLRVDTLDAGGNIPSGNAAAGQTGAHKGYALEVLTGATVCNTCSLGGIDELAVYTPITLSGTTAGFEIPLVDIPTDYAGLTVNFYVYDPGDLGTGFTANDLSIIDPDTRLPAAPSPGQAAVPIYNLGTSLTMNSPYPIPPNDNGGVGDGSGERPVTTSEGTSGTDATLNTTWCNALNGGAGPNSSDTGDWNLNGGQSKNSCYNGEWLDYQVTIPSGYAGNSGQPGGPPCTVPNGTPGAGAPDPICGQFWGLEYAVTGTAGSSSNDTFTLAVSVNGSPTHLLP